MLFIDDREKNLQPAKLLGIGNYHFLTHRTLKKDLKKFQIVIE